MSDLNVCSFTGRLTRDPESRAVGEKTVVKFSIAVGRTYRKDGQPVEETAFIDCEAWSPLADIIQAHCGKGRQVAVSGRIKMDSWEKDGQKRTALKLVVAELTMLARPADQAGGSSTQPAPAAAPRVPAASSGGGRGEDEVPFAAFIGADVWG